MNQTVKFLRPLTWGSSNINLLHNQPLLIQASSDPLFFTSFNNPPKGMDASLTFPNISDNPALAFTFRRISTIKAFFNSQLVDVPLCFKKSSSLYSLTFEMPIVKFHNILMRGGHRAQTQIYFTRSLQLAMNRVTPTISTQQYRNWELTFLFFESTFLSPYMSTLAPSTRINPFVTPALSSDVLSPVTFFNKKSTFLGLLFANLRNFTPVFNFYIRKVDKSIRKNTRGKGQKYSIIWKYVPIYKRLYVTMRWLLKDLKFQKLPSFVERLAKVFETFLLSPQNSFLVRLRRFVHQFVFFNHKFSLMRHLKSVS